MLEELDVEKRLRMIAAKLATQLDVLELQSKIQSQVKENIDKSQRRYYLQEQMKAIRKELGEGDASTGGEIEQLREKLREMRAMGLPLPADLVALEKRLDDDFYSPIVRTPFGRRVLGDRPRRPIALRGDSIGGDAA